MKRIIINICLLIFSLTLYAQDDYDWWNLIHDWDGVTHWSEYIVMSADHMGPNALPVPLLKDGRIEKEYRLEMAADVHHSKGDKTQNIYLDLFIPVVKDKVGLHLNVVPIEHYEMDISTRDERFSRDYDAKGFSGGDIYVGTQIQVLKGKERLPDILISMNLKTASGTNLGGARHTDMAGYYFDVAFGKKQELNNSAINYISSYVVAGFYSWQTNMDNNPQNDAFLYGVGIKTGIKQLEFNNNIAGYIGYFNNGDRPMVYRLGIKTLREKKLNFQLMFQQGIHDFGYSTFRFSFIYKFNLSGNPT